MVKIKSWNIIFFSSISWPDQSPIIKKFLISLPYKYKLYYIYWSNISYFKYYISRHRRKNNKDVVNKYCQNIRLFNVLNILPQRFSRLNNLQNIIKYKLLKIILSFDDSDKIIWLAHHNFFHLINKLNEKVIILDSLDLSQRPEKLVYYDNPGYFNKFTPIFYDRILGVKNNLHTISWRGNIYARCNKIIQSLDYVLNKIN